MKRKRLLLIFGCLAAVLLAGYVTLRLTAPRHAITSTNVQAIQEGMTEAEVVEILAVPAGNYSTGKYQGVEHYAIVSLIFSRGGKVWLGDEAGIWVQFDQAGKVCDKSCVWFTRPEESLLAKLRRWLGM
jgi:hypothetical protein